MNEASESLDFEEQEYRNLIQHIHNLTKKQKSTSDNTIETYLATVCQKVGCVFMFS